MWNISTGVRLIVLSYDCESLICDCSDYDWNRQITLHIQHHNQLTQSVASWPLVSPGVNALANALVTTPFLCFYTLPLQRQQFWTPEWRTLIHTRKWDTGNEEVTPAPNFSRAPCDLVEVKTKIAVTLVQFISTWLPWSYKYQLRPSLTLANNVNSSTG